MTLNLLIFVLLSLCSCLVNSQDVRPIQRVPGPDSLVTDGTRNLTLTYPAESSGGGQYTWFTPGNDTTRCKTQQSGKVCIFIPRLEDDNQNVSCTLIDPGPVFSTAFYQVNLKYPPQSIPSITIGTRQTEPLKHGDIITCTVTGGKPSVTSVTFHCQHPDHADREDDVNNRTHTVSSSIVVNTSLSTDVDMTCTCYANWAPEPGLYSHRTNMSFELQHKARITEFTVNDTTKLTVSETSNSTVTFTCQGDGRPSPILRLFKQGNDTALIQAEINSTTHQLLYHIDNASGEDMATYRCEADNTFLFPNNTCVHLVVNSAPRFVDYNSSDPRTLPPEGLTFSLVAYPTPKYKESYYLGNGNVTTPEPAPENTFKLELTRNNSVEHLVNCHVTDLNVSQDKLGLYEVSVTNKLGDASFRFRVERKGDAYDLTECNSDDNFDIVQNQQPVLTCTGLGRTHNISWSIRNSSSGNEMRIGTCGGCKAGCSGCSPLVEGYNISRDFNGSTTLQFLNHSLVTSRSTIKCSNLKNRFNATCTLFVVPAYRFSECRAGAIMVAENKTSPIVCEGLLAAQNMYWTVAYENGTVSTIAQCSYCQQNTTTCPKCTITDADFNVTREQNSSTLVIHNNVRQKDGATLTCSKKDNVTHSDCNILVVSLDLNQERATGLPVAAVAGSAVGFVVIVAIVIFIVVILKRRRSKREATEKRRDTVPLEGEFEEHINELYQRADDPDLPRHSPQNSLAPLPLANPSVDPQGPGSDGAQNHVYSQVNKGKNEQSEDNKDKPGKAHDVKQLTTGGQAQKHADTGDKGGPSPEEQGAVYTECVSDNKEDNSVTNVYMNVDESPPLRPDQDTQAAKKDSGNEDLHDPDLNPYHNTETTRH